MRPLDYLQRLFGGIPAVVPLVLAGLLRATAQDASTLPLKLEKGDRIAILGNALPDRMQHSGHFETLVHARFPNSELVFRNLAAAGDEVVTRHRSENFGSPDQWLSRVKADVILAFFGFNESFKGYEGLKSFRNDLDKFLKDTKAKNYSGKGAPRIVLFSPIAAERHQDPSFPDPTAINSNVRLYASAMAEVATANGVPFIDLIQPSMQLFSEATAQGRSLTANGIHLTEQGDALLASQMFQALFRQPAPTGDHEKLRRAVNAKNWEWHQRYRTIDGYNVYGGRSQLSYESGKGGPKISNYQVMQEEMQQRDVLTANRDPWVWALARGESYTVDDSNLPPVTKVRSNKPGPNPDDSHTFLSGEAAIGRMKVHSGMKVNLFASEERFPDLINPVQMGWDTRGRLWVSAWRNYPERTPDSKRGDSLLVFEDTDNDGSADKVTPFLDDLNGPTGFQFYRDGVIVVQAPDLWFVRDTDGDGRGDWKERILMGLDSADSHHTANAVVNDPGGAIYLSDGVFHRTQVETASGPVRNNDGAIFRFEPRTGKFETYVAYGFANPHGKVFDRWGNDLITDATGNNTYFGPAFSGFIDYPAKHPGLRQFWERPSRPCPGTGMISSRHFPDEFQGNYLNLNVIGFLGIFRVRVTEEGSGLKGETLENLVSSEDPNFRPSAVSVGPDGAIYFTDWHNPIIGHMQHHIRDPNRDHGHGRIYRITYPGRPLIEKPVIAGAPIPALLELLKAPEDGTRDLAKVELGARPTAEVIAATKRWVAALDTSAPEYEHHRLEGLWVHQWHHVVDLDLLKAVLRSPDHRARAAATRVVCYWRDRLPDPLGMLRERAADEHPRVRLEAIRATSFFRNADAAEVALAALKRPTDYYIDYVLAESLRQLEPHWRRAISDGQPIASDNPAGIDYLVKKVSTSELLKLPRTEGVHVAILSRPDVADPVRVEVLSSLVSLRKSNGAAVVLDTVDVLSRKQGAAAATVARLLPWQLAPDLKAQRGRIGALATGSSDAEVRRAAWAGLLLADGGIDAAWNEARRTPATLADLVAGIPMLLDPDLRAATYPRVRTLLGELPDEIRALASTRPAATGRFVRVELPRRGTLTLAEVEVFAGDRNVARQGKATQSSTSNGGDAGRAIDGRTDPSFSSGTQTHTLENTVNPWWEVDLGSEQPIENIVVWNRSESGLGKRLDGFTLSVLDGQRREVFKQAGIPAPDRDARIPVASDPLGAIRRSAIRAAVSIPVEQGTTFAALSRLIDRGDQVVAAAQGLRVLPRAVWPRESAAMAAEALVGWARKTPAAARTTQDYVETVQTASELSGLLSPEKAAAMRRELKDLRVDVYVIRTVREQMRYDTPRIVVAAGKPFELVLENTDFMPHNLVLVRPGTRVKVGMISDLMKPDEMDAAGRPFIPKSAEVLEASRLLEPGQRQTLKITAPEAEGEYEYMCTFPGHWPLMWGRLIVTRDVDAYLEKNPIAADPTPTPIPEK